MLKWQFYALVICKWLVLLQKLQYSYFPSNIETKKLICLTLLWLMPRDCLILNTNALFHHMKIAYYLFDCFIMLWMVFQHFLSPRSQLLTTINMQQGGRTDNNLWIELGNNWCPHDHNNWKKPHKIPKDYVRLDIIPRKGKI